MGTLKDDPILLTRKLSPSSSYMLPYIDSLRDIAQDAYHMTTPKKKNVETTLDSWDLKKETDYKGKEYSHAMNYFYLNYAQILISPISTTEEIHEAMHHEKSAGYPANSYGIHTKSDLLSCPQYLEWFLGFDPMSGEYTPIWMVSPKVEFKETADILANKIRLFQIPPHHLLHYQLKYGRKISERLKNFKWSAYGFNPYDGGFNDLASKLLTKRWRFSYDVSGWDKFLPNMEDVYNAVLFKNPDFTSREFDEFRWVMMHTIKPLLRFPSGAVYSKPYGNPSGSGTTTRDNILCHVLILTYALTCAHIEKTGVCPSYEKIDEQVAYLFGDDNIGSVDDEFSLMCDFEFLSAVFQRFGMKLKFLQGGEDAPLEELSFLGASFVKIEGMWLPHYNPVRLATSMVYDDGNLSVSEYISKIHTLTVMSFPTKYFEVFHNAYKSALTKLVNYKDPVVQSHVRFGGLNPSDLMCFFTGREATTVTLQSRIYFFVRPMTRLIIVFKEAGRSKRSAMAQVSRGERLLNKWASSPQTTFTLSGKDWFVAAADPFHDTPLKHLAGWPDVEVGMSVVRCVKQQATISKPSGFPDANWDCHLALLPWLNAETFTETTDLTRSNNTGIYSGNFKRSFGWVNDMSHSSECGC